MKVFLLISSFLSLAAAAQDISNPEQEKIYQQVLKEYSTKGDVFINETISRIYIYDIDGNYNRLHTPSSTNAIICVTPIKYENTVFDFLLSQNILVDTNSLYRQINDFKAVNLQSYNLSTPLTPFTKTPMRRSYLGNLFKKRKAVSLSPVLIDIQRM